MTARNEREAHSLMAPATDSELERWLEAADRKKAEADHHQVLALVLGVAPLIVMLIVGSLMLIARGCA